MLTVRVVLLPYEPLHAEVAELADALRSGRSPLTRVWVRLPSSAQNPPVYAGFLFLKAALSYYGISGFSLRLGFDDRRETQPGLSGLGGLQLRFLANPAREGAFDAVRGHAAVLFVDCGPNTPQVVSTASA